MNEPRVNLFVYGSLRVAKIFKSVCGLGFTLEPSEIDENTLFAEHALLGGYRKVSPDGVYFYGVADQNGKIDGYLVYNVTHPTMSEIEKYEGSRYDCENVDVNTAHGSVRAKAYLASHESMKKHFGDRFHVNLIHELWLRKRIEDFLEKHTRPGEKTPDAEFERRADRQLLGTTERDLVMSHYQADAVSDYYLEHELDRPRPTIRHIDDNSEVKPYIENYLALLVRQVLFNELDDKIQNRYRYNLERMNPSNRYYKRSVSILAALRMINTNRDTVDLIVDRCIRTMPLQKHDLFDYVKYAVHAANSMFDPRVAWAFLEWIQSNQRPGLIPLGAEIELSNIGSWAVEPDSESKPKDPTYNSFKFFQDFSLHILFWKLGGYIDDHSPDTEKPRRKGFLELAPGRLSLIGELSRPVTSDPWLLNQTIHEIVNFYDAKPHSLHLSFQLLKKQVGKQKVLPLDFVKCLLVLGGGLVETNTGRLWISRMHHDEIKQHDYGEELVFARTSKKNWYLGQGDIGERVPRQATTYIQQYKFIRLEERANYEALIMALKGLQIAYNPAEYLSANQLKSNPHLRRQYKRLKEWSANPEPMSHQTIGRFINTIYRGLMTERHKNPAHKLHYIDWAVNAVNVQLRMFNQELQKTTTTH